MRDSNTTLHRPKKFLERTPKTTITYDIKHSSTMGAIAMVLNNIKSLVVNSNHTFSDVEMNILKHHELESHMAQH